VSQAAPPPPPPPCTFTIAPTSQTVADTGGSGSVAVTASAGTCTWTATANAPWLTVTAGASGTGNGTVSFTAGANTGVARAGTLTIGGQTFTVSQAAPPPPPCTFTIAPTSQNIGDAGGPGSIAVTASAGTCTWTASANDGWLTVTGGASGTGNGTVTFTVAANTGAARSGTLTIGGQTFTVTQAAPVGVMIAALFTPSGEHHVRVRDGQLGDLRAFPGEGDFCARDAGRKEHEVAHVIEVLTRGST